MFVVAGYDGPVIDVAEVAVATVKALFHQPSVCARLSHHLLVLSRTFILHFVALAGPLVELNGLGHGFSVGRSVAHDVFDSTHFGSSLGLGESKGGAGEEESSEDGLDMKHFQELAVILWCWLC